MRDTRGVIQPSEGERIWTDALTALLIGLGSVEEARTSTTEICAKPPDYPRRTARPSRVRLH